MKTIKVNETFKTIQGEAFYTGTPSLFIRLQGCPVWCNWCDTKFTWHLGKKNKLVDKNNIIDKKGQDELYAEINYIDLLNEAKKKEIKHIVITGGEPLIHNLKEFTNLLIDNNFNVQIETSCTQQAEIDDRCWLTGSPKINMAGKQVMNADTLKRCNEIKFPILNENDCSNLLDLINLYNLQDKLIWVQPVEINNNIDQSLELCLKLCYQYNYRLSIQVHKAINLK